MEPQIIDYYNEMPSGANVIEKMNEEFSILNSENNILKKTNQKYCERLTKLKKYEMIKIEVSSKEELFIKGKSVIDNIPKFTTIIYDFLNHTGWCNNLPETDGSGLHIMCHAGLGYWDFWETDLLEWSGCTYGYDNSNNFHYNKYLKLKIIEELHTLFNLEKKNILSWFNYIIDEAFNQVELTIYNLIENNISPQNPDILKNIIHKIIMTKLFGWNDETDEPREVLTNNEYLIQNIYYFVDCEKCGQIFVGNNYDDYDFYDNDCVCED